MFFNKCVLFYFKKNCSISKMLIKNWCNNNYMKFYLFLEIYICSLLTTEIVISINSSKLSIELPMKETFRLFFFACTGLRKFHGPLSSPSRSAIVLMTWVNCHASHGLIQSTGDALNAGFYRARFSFSSTFSSFSLLLLNAVERAVKKCESLIGRIGSFTRLLAIRWSPQFRSPNRPCGLGRSSTSAKCLLAVTDFSASELCREQLQIILYCEKNWSVTLVLPGLLKAILCGQKSFNKR